MQRHAMHIPLSIWYTKVDFGSTAQPAMIVSFIIPRSVWRKGWQPCSVLSSMSLHYDKAYKA